MRRIVSILLCICVLVVCALIAWFGHQQMQIEVNAEPGIQARLKSVTCEQMLTRIPNGLDEFELTQFYAGKRFVSMDGNNDGRWERVYVPVFDRPLKEIRRNYKAIVLVFADVTDVVELRKRLQQEALQAQYWPYSQKFDYKAYNSLAEKYSSLDFDRSLIVHCGFPKSRGMAGYLYWGGAAGVLLALLGMGWQSLGLITIVIRKSAALEQAKDDEDEDEEDLEFMNRAGLPTIKRD